MFSYTTPLGKGLIDETDATFVGCYNGNLSRAGVPESVHASDCVLNIGPLLSDSNTGGFTREIKDENTIMLHPSYISVKGKLYKGVHFGDVLKELVAKIDGSKVKPLGQKPRVAPLVDEPTKHISQDYLLTAVEKYLQPHDILIAESGTFQFSAPTMTMKAGCTYYSQVFYSSIGFALPAAFGSAIAHREMGLKGRVVLVEGDGSAQMTIQELGSMVRHNLPLTIFLLNNDGYSIERAIWGPKQGYNDICPRWKWTQLLSAFGGDEGKTIKNHLVQTRQEMEHLIADNDFNNSSKTQLVEVILDAYDYPWILEGQIKLMGGKNIQAFKEYAAARNED
jgi:pyruvate decarboxylase